MELDQIFTASVFASAIRLANGIGNGVCQRDAQGETGD